MKNYFRVLLFLGCVFILGATLRVFVEGGEASWGITAILALVSSYVTFPRPAGNRG